MSCCQLSSWVFRRANVFQRSAGGIGAMAVGHRSVSRHGSPPPGGEILLRPWSAGQEQVTDPFTACLGGRQDQRKVARAWQAFQILALPLYFGHSFKTRFIRSVFIAFPAVEGGQGRRGADNVPSCSLYTLRPLSLPLADTLDHSCRSGTRPLHL